MIVVGDGATLQADRYWGRLIKYIDSKGAVLEEPDVLLVLILPDIFPERRRVFKKGPRTWESTVHTCVFDKLANHALPRPANDAQQLLTLFLPWRRRLRPLPCHAAVLSGHAVGDLPPSQMAPQKRKLSQFLGATPLHAVFALGARLPPRRIPRPIEPIYKNLSVPDVM